MSEHGDSDLSRPITLTLSLGDWLAVERALMVAHVCAPYHPNCSVWLDLMGVMGSQRIAVTQQEVPTGEAVVNSMLSALRDVLPDTAYEHAKGLLTKTLEPGSDDDEPNLVY